MASRLTRREAEATSAVELGFPAEAFSPVEESTERSHREPTQAQLKLVTKKISMRFCEFKISNSTTRMLQTESIAASNRGLLFHSASSFPKGTLMRMLIEMPDYWARKAKYVSYRHTDAPKYFQILGRVVICEEVTRKQGRYQILCETVNFDAVDERIFCEYLGIEAPAS